MHRSFRILALIVFFFVAFCSCERSPESQLYLTWNQDNTSTGITVNFHDPGNQSRELHVHYGPAHYSPAPGEGGPSRYPHTQALSGKYSEAGRRMVYSADLSGLTPNTGYHFVIAENSRPLTGEEKFRTLPDDGKSEIRFIVGADMGMGSTVDNLQRMASLRDPMFALLGGDIAYDNGEATNFHLWDEWLRSWSKNMRRADKSLVPIILAVGNHEVRGGYGAPAESAPFYRDYFFPGEQRSYYSRQVGGHSAIYVLDTDHLAAIDGPQKEWLKEVLTRDQALPNRFALYHVPLYPSVRSPEDGVSVRARQSWGPLFDAFHLTAGFEHHDHALKRTHPLKAGVPAPDGTLYIGDGCFGTKPRGIASGRPYIARSESVRHFWNVTASADRVRMEAFDGIGRLRDSALIAR